jgi:hypothetical protein
MPKIDPLLNDVKARLKGQPADMTTATSSPPYNPVSRDKMTAGISAKLHGSQAPGDWAPTDANAPSDPTDASGQSAEDEARDKLSQLDDGSDIIAAIDNPDDELHATAVRLLKAYTALVEQERKRGAGGQP